MYKCPNCGASNSYAGDPYPCSQCGFDGRVQSIPALRFSIDTRRTIGIGVVRKLTEAERHLRIARQQLSELKNVTGDPDHVNLFVTVQQAETFARRQQHRLALRMHRETA